MFVNVGAEALVQVTATSAMRYEGATRAVVKLERKAESRSSIATLRTLR